MWVDLAGTSQRNDRQIGHAVVGDAKVRMLSCENDARADAEGDQRFG
jgi:hypothetical protein